MKLKELKGTMNLVKTNLIIEKSKKENLRWL